MPVDQVRAWETLQKLSFERISGTEKELEAAKMIQAECQAAGVEATIEAFEVDHPVIENVSFSTVLPEVKEYPVIAVGKTASTKNDGVIGKFKYIENALPQNLIDVKDCVVLLNGGAAKGILEKLEENGALAYIATQGSYYDPEDLKNELRPYNVRENRKVKIPGLVMHVSDATELVLSKPESVKVVLHQQSDAKAMSHNVVATIEGTDAQLKQEVLALSAHYDSVRYSSGAWDNMSGSVTLLELMHHFVENPPKRTLKFIWCGSEEIGLCGSEAYCLAHKDELKNYIYNINFDMTGVTLGYEKFVCSANDACLHALEYIAKLENYPVVTAMDLYPSDSTSFAVAGVPSCTFARLGAPGTKQIHNHYDTMDYMDPDSFMITLNFALTYASQIANCSMNPIAREFSEKITPKLEELRKQLEEKTKKAKKEKEKKEKKEKDKEKKAKKEAKEKKKEKK